MSHEHDAADMAVDGADEKKKDKEHGHTHSHEVHIGALTSI